MVRAFRQAKPVESFGQQFDSQDISDELAARAKEVERLRRESSRIKERVGWLIGEKEKLEKALKTSEAET